MLIYFNLKIKIFFLKKRTKFFGTFKLRRDPKIEFLSIDNIILRG